MASSIDKNPHNPLAQHESGQPQNSAPVGKQKPATAAKPAAAPRGAEATESFSAARGPSSPKAAVSQPMLGAFAKAGPKPAQRGTAPAAGSLMEQQNVFTAASNILAKTSGSPSNAGGASALGKRFLTMFTARPAVGSDEGLKADVDVLKAARDRISVLDNPTQLEKATLNAAQKGLAGIKT